jgi:aldose 1-epimerase
MGDTARVLEHPSSDGIRVTIIRLGATITSVRVPDKHGNRGECVLGFDREEPYLGRSPYFGSVAGRVANRTANAEFDLDGKRYELHANNGHHQLHGGKEGFNLKRWAVVEATATQLTLALRSPDGDEGYPGTVDVRVTYSLPTESTLKITYSATTDRATPLNLTNHSYWNLEDGGASSVDRHVIRLDAQFYTPTDDDSIPTGEVRAVKATPMDYSAPRVVGEGLEACDQGNGVDHNFVLSAHVKEEGLRPVATLWAPTSGRLMKVWTTEPGVQFYTGNFLDGSLRRRDGAAPYGKRAGLCLECQHFPDSVHRSHFPSIVLRPGETYAQTTVHEFSIAASRGAAFGEGGDVMSLF